MIGQKPDRPKVDDLVCPNCFTGPGAGAKSVRINGKITTAPEPISAFDLVIEAKPVARCRHCGARHNAFDLRRWNVTMLPKHIRDGVKINRMEGRQIRAGALRVA